MPIAYLSPFVNETNDYINRVKSILVGCGYDVQPFSFRTLLSPKALGLFKRDNVVLMHWLESRVFSEGRSGARIRPAGLLQFAIYVLVLASMRARLVYFVHDHAVHDLTGWRRAFSVRLIWLLRQLADVRVVHDPSFCDAYQATYLPHPLYQERNPEAMQTRPATGTFRAGILGAVRPYKRIEHIIDVWPEGPELLIRGRSDAAYEQLLRERIQARGPGVRIQLVTGFMSREEFESEMGQLDALILPHADASALVSGAFFEAIGATPVVIARSTPFIRWATTDFPGVLPYEQEPQIANLLRRAESAKAELRQQMPQAAERANAQFGVAHCVEAYGQVLSAG
jgi:hypothetical protein